MRALVLVSIAACGRFDFGTHGDASVATHDGGDVTDGLVVHLELESIDGVGATVDSAGNHTATCDPTMSQCPAIGPGRFGNGAIFDGNDDQIAIADALDLDQPQAFTVAAWIQLAAPVTVTGCPFQKILGAHDEDTWELCINPGGQVYFFSSASPLDNTNDDTLSVHVPVSVGPWHHMAITWDDGARRKEIWLDGDRVVEGVGVALTPLFDSGPILIGIDRDAGSDTSAFAGAIDDFRIYDRALTPDELLTLATP